MRKLIPIVGALLAGVVSIVPIVGPLLGGLFGALVYDFGVRPYLPLETKP